MWLLHRRSKAYHLNPSDELGLENPLIRYQFNRVCELYGQRVDDLLEQRKTVGKGKKAKQVPVFTLEEALERASFGKRKTTKTSGVVYISALFAQHGTGKRIVI